MLYIILVNYNGWRDTIECIESLLKSRMRDFRIIICDNASIDQSADYLSAWLKKKVSRSGFRAQVHGGMDVDLPNFSDEVRKDIKAILSVDNITLFSLVRNTGFARANNIGMQYAMVCGDTDFIWLLNNDTTVEPDTIDALIRKYHEYEKQGIRLGVIGPKLLMFGKSNTLQGIGGIYNKYTGISSTVGAYEVDTGQYDNPNAFQGIEIISGASMFFPIASLMDVGLLSEEYFLYLEENDWCTRAVNRGWVLGYCWEAKVYHKIGRSIGTADDGRQRSRISDFYGLKNRLLFSKKYHSRYFIFVLGGFFIVLFNRVIRGQFDRVPLLARIIWEVLLKKSSRYHGN
jgi:GT2 family glycosyltransferase